MNNTNEQTNDYIENNINFSTPAVYPQDEPIKLEQSVDINEFISRFSVYLLSAKDSKHCLCAILYSINYDVGLLLGTENTITSIAKVLGLSKATFSKMIKTIALDLNIKGCNTGMLSQVKQKYSETNYRKI